MIAPEQWHEYQKQYNKYGLDMSPERESRRDRIERRKSVQTSQATVLSFSNDRKILLTTVLICAVALIMVVLMTSYAAKLTYDNNKTKAANDVLIGEIEDMDVEMLSAESIGYVEQIAKKDLGMKVATEKQIVYVSANDVPQKGFGKIVKSKAYE